MSDTDDIDAIRQEKREELAEQLGGGGEQQAESGTGQGPDEPVHVEGGEHLQQLADSYDVVLVDYHADWCGPCRMLEPVVEEIARETPAAVAKVDIDVHQTLAAQAGVQGVPTLMLYADGEAVERLVGVQDQATLENLVRQYAG